MAYKILEATYTASIDIIDVRKVKRLTRKTILETIDKCDNPIVISSWRQDKMLVKLQKEMPHCFRIVTTGDIETKPENEADCGMIFESSTVTTKAKDAKG